MRKLSILFTLLLVFFSFTTNTKAITDISINNQTIVPEFNKNTNIYNVFVSSKTEIITINVTKEENEVVTGSGSISLKKGLNIIEIIAYINDIQTEKYTLNIVRGEIKNDTKDATLRSLEVSSFDIDFDTNTYEYTLEASTESKRLVIKYEPTNPNSKVKLKGDINLNNETNVIELTVTSEDKKNTNTYRITVNKIKDENKGVEHKEGLFDTREFTPFQLKLIIIGLCFIGVIILLIIFFLLFIKKRKEFKVVFKPMKTLRKSKI